MELKSRCHQVHTDTVLITADLKRAFLKQSLQYENMLFQQSRQNVSRLLDCDEMVPCTLHLAGRTGEFLLRSLFQEVILINKTAESQALHLQEVDIIFMRIIGVNCTKLKIKNTKTSGARVVFGISFKQNKKLFLPDNWKLLVASVIKDLIRNNTKYADFLEIGDLWYNSTHALRQMTPFSEIQLTSLQTHFDKFSAHFHKMFDAVVKTTQYMHMMESGEIYRIVKKFGGCALFQNEGFEHLMYETKSKIENVTTQGGCGHILELDVMSIAALKILYRCNIDSSGKSVTITPDEGGEGAISHLFREWYHLEGRKGTVGSAEWLALGHGRITENYSAFFEVSDYDCTIRFNSDMSGIGLASFFGPDDEDDDDD